MRWMAPTAVACAASAVAAAVWLWPSGPPSLPVSGPASRSAIAEAELYETVKRQQRQLDEIERRVLLLDQQVRTLAPAASQPDDGTATAPREVVIRGFRRVDAAALLEAGLSPADAAELKRLVDEAYAVHAREQSLYLRQDVAASEDIRDQITRRLGGHAYDAYLYATGQRNRLVVASVVEGSAAQNAGIREGDILSSLDGRPVYSHRDLQAITAAAGPSLIEIEVARKNGERIRTLVSRDQLGLVTVPGRSSPRGSSG